MQKSNVFTGLAILVIVVVVGVGIGWLATRTNAPAAPPTATISEMTEPTVTRDRPPIQRPKPVTPSVPKPLPPVQTSVAQAVPTPAPATLITDWEDKLDEILSSDDEDTNKVKQLFAMFRNLPEEGQDEVAQHLSNLVEDEDYAMLGKLLLDPKLPEAVLDTLLADLLNRPNAAKLPMFLEIAFTPNHPSAAEARDLLELYLDEDDFGNDRPRWERAMQDWLKENPD
jgi:hypothetical protein